MEPLTPPLPDNVLTARVRLSLARSLAVVVIYGEKRGVVVEDVDAVEGCGEVKMSDGFCSGESIRALRGDFGR